MRARRGHYWPSPQQRLLLRASLLNGQTALAAWREWKATVDIETADLGTQRILPLLAHNLRALGVDEAELGGFKGVMRFAWATQQRHLMLATPAVEALHDAGIEMLLLKDIALAQDYYDHPGLRTLEAVDLLVSAAAAPRAIALLRAGGWQTAAPAVDLAAVGGRTFTSAGGGTISLRWHALWEFAGPAADDEIWARADRTTLGVTPVAMLSASDLLLQVIVDGSRWNSVPPLRWVADAATILSAPLRVIDWTSIVACAEAYGVVLPLKQGLDFIGESLGLPLPADAMAALAAHRASRFERVEQRMREWTSPALGRLPLTLCHHARLRRDEGPFVAAWRLPRYLQHVYQLPTLRQLPGALCLRVARHLRAHSSAP